MTSPGVSVANCENQQLEETDAGNASKRANGTILRTNSYLKKSPGKNTPSYLIKPLILKTRIDTEIESLKEKS